MLSLRISILLNLITTTTSCKGLFSINSAGDKYPVFPFDVCFESQINGLKKSDILTCDTNGTLKHITWYNNDNCNGSDFDESKYNLTRHFSDDDDYVVQCDANECPYAISKTYYSTTCERSGDFRNAPVVVDECYHWGSSMSIRWICTPSELRLNQYSGTVCSSDKLWASTPLKKNGCNENNQYTEIIYCGMSDYNEKVRNVWLNLSISYLILAALSLIGLIINVIIVGVILYHLYECEHCKLGFSDKHNWLIKPSSLNKTFALLSTTLYATWFLERLINSTVSCMYTFKIFQNNVLTGYVFNYSKYIVTIVLNFARLFYFLYLTSTLEYYTKEELLVNYMISAKSMKFIKCLIGINFVMSLLWLLFDEVLNNGLLYYDIPYFVIHQSIQSMLVMLIVLYMFYLYYLGINNICHFWYSKHPKSFDETGENEKTHEELKNITRIAVSVTMSVVALVIATTAVSISNLFYDPYDLNVDFMWVALIGFPFGVISNICSVLTVYFIYPFSHRRYEKICGSCDKRMNKYLKKKLQRQVKKGRFDGYKYRTFSKAESLDHRDNFNE